MGGGQGRSSREGEILGHRYLTKEAVKTREGETLSGGGGREGDMEREGREEIKGYRETFCFRGGSKSNYATWSSDDCPPPQVAKTI